MTRYQRHESRVGATGSYITQFCEGFERIADIPFELGKLWVEYAQSLIPGAERRYFDLKHNKVFMVVHSDEKVDIAVYQRDFNTEVYLFDKQNLLPGRIIAVAEQTKRQRIGEASKRLEQLKQPHWAAKQKSDEDFVDNIGRHLIKANDEVAWAKYDAQCAQTWEAYESQTAQFDAEFKAVGSEAKASCVLQSKPAYDWHTLLPLPAHIADEWMASIQDGSCPERDSREIAIDTCDGVSYLKQRAKSRA